MKRKGRAGILGAFIVAGSSLGAIADIKGNPYQSIAARNPFGLRPMPAPTVLPVELPPAIPLPEIKLTGITTLLASSKALFQYEDWQTKKVEFPSPLSEGETYKTFTVLGIDVENQRVRIRNGSREATLDFVNDGVKPTVIVAGPAATRLPLPNAVRPPVPPNPVLNNPSASNTNSRVIILGPLPPESPAPGGSISVQQTALPPAMTREEAEALIEIARKKYQMQEQSGQTQPGQPVSNLFPPTRLGDALQQPFAPPSR